MTMPNIQGSTPQGGGVTLRCLGEGRLVLVFPIEEYTGHEFGKPSEPKQFIRCNVVALPDPQSAPFITYGGEMTNTGQMKTPDTTRIDVGPQGTLFEGMSIGGGGMLYILRKALKTPTGPSARVGRLYKDAQYNGAWKLTDVDNNGPEVAAAAAWIQAFNAGQFVNPVAQPIPVVPQQAAPQSWPQQNAAPAQNGWGAPQQQAPQQSWPTNGQQPQQQQQQQQPAQGGWGPQVQQNTVPQQGWGAPQQQPAQQAPQGWGTPPQTAPVGPGTEQPTGF